jgi:hypothetical protein
MEPVSRVAELRISARKVIAEILAQLERREDALQGVEAIVIEKELAYHRGEFVVKETREKPWSLEEEGLEGYGGPYEVLGGSNRILEELPSSEGNEIRIRATPPVPDKVDTMDFPGPENLAVTVTMSVVPPRLLKMEAEFVHLPKWLKWLLKTAEVEMVFDYIRGVPVLKTGYVHLLSRGIGPLRFGMGNETETRYKEW